MVGLTGYPNVGKPSASMTLFVTLCADGMQTGGGRATIGLAGYPSVDKSSTINDFSCYALY